MVVGEVGDHSEVGIARANATDGMGLACRKVVVEASL